MTDPFAAAEQARTDAWVRFVLASPFALLLSAGCSLSVGVVSLVAGASMVSWLLGCVAPLGGIVARCVALAVTLGILVGIVWLTYRLARATFTKMVAAWWRFAETRSTPFR